ncbi:MAG: hypothetical protein N4A49_14650 [Marinifilaceae bacterium]|jgi:hypothetical protein|nr:hypothetical protein [Marinifilaceae bacterium]
MKESLEISVKDSDSKITIYPNYFYVNQTTVYGDSSKGLSNYNFTPPSTIKFSFILKDKFKSPSEWEEFCKDKPGFFVKTAINRENQLLEILKIIYQDKDLKIPNLVELAYRGKTYQVQIDSKEEVDENNELKISFGFQLVKLETV